MAIELQGEPAGVAVLLGVPRLLDAMRAHYGAVPSPDTARPPACGGGLLPAELRALRQGLLNTALSLLLHLAVPHHKATRIATDDIQVHVMATSQMLDTRKRILCILCGDAYASLLVCHACLKGKTCHTQIPSITSNKIDLPQKAFWEA